MNPRATAILTMRWQGGPAMAAATRSMRQFSTQAAFSGRVVDAFARRTTRAMTGLLGFFKRQATNVFRSFFFGIRIWAIMAGASVAAFAGKAIKSFMEFDKKLRETSGLIRATDFTQGVRGARLPGSPGGTRITQAELRRIQANAKRRADEEYKAYQKAIIAMAPSVRRTPSELAGGVYELTQAGFAKGGARARRTGMGILRAAAMGSATAGGGDVNDAVRSLVTQFNALGLGKPNRRTGRGGGALQATRTGRTSAAGVTDRVFQAILSGIGLNYSDLNQQLGAISGTAGTFQNPKKQGRRGHQLLDQILATMVAGTQAGMQPAKIGQGYQNILQKLARPSKAAEGIYERLGINPSQELLKRQLFGPQGIISLIEKRMDRLKIKGGERSTILSTLFPDVRGTRLMGTMRANVDLYTAALLDLQGATGATKIAFDEQGRSLQGQIDKFKVLWETFKIGLGASAMPTVKSALDWGSNYLSKITGGALGAQRSAELEAKLEGVKDPDRRKAIRAKFMDRLKPRGRRALRAYEEFVSLGPAGQFKRIGKTIWEDLRTWAERPETHQQFKDIMMSAIQKGMDLIGAGLERAPEAYTWGLNLAKGIEKGILDYLGTLSPGSLIKKGLSGGGGEGGRFFDPKDKFDLVNAGILGLVAARAVSGRAKGGGLIQRGARGGAFAGAGALMGIPSAMLPLLFGAGALGPSRSTAPAGAQMAALRARIGFRRAVGLSVPQQLLDRQAAGTAAAAEASGMRTGAMTVTARTVVVNAQRARMSGGGGGGGGGARTTPGVQPSLGGYPIQSNAANQKVVYNPNSGRWHNVQTGAFAAAPPGVKPGTVPVPVAAAPLVPMAPAAPADQTKPKRPNVLTRGARAITGGLRGAKSMYGTTLGGAAVQGAISGGVSAALGDEMIVAAATAGGAAIGSLGGPIGTMLGGVIGNIAGTKIVDWLDKDSKEREAREYQAQVGGFVQDLFAGGVTGKAASNVRGAIQRPTAQGGLGLQMGGSATVQMEFSRALIALGRARRPKGIQAAMDRLSLTERAMGGWSPQLAALVLEVRDQADQRLATDIIERGRGNLPGGTDKDKRMKPIKVDPRARLDGVRRKPPKKTAIPDIGGPRGRGGPGSGVPEMAAMTALGLLGIPGFPMGFAAPEVGVEWGMFGAPDVRWKPPKGSTEKRPPPAPTILQDQPPIPGMVGLDVGKTGEPLFPSFAGAGKATNVGIKLVEKIYGPVRQAAETKKKGLRETFSAVGKVAPRNFQRGFDAEANRVNFKPAIDTMMQRAIDQATAAAGGTPVTGAGDGGGGRNDAPPQGPVPTGGGSSAVGITPPSSPGAQVAADRGMGARAGAGGLGRSFAAAGGRAAINIAPRLAQSAVTDMMSGPLGGAVTALGWLRGQVGKPYIWGGGHPPNSGLEGYDCSGLASTAMQMAGIPLAGTTTSLIPSIKVGGTGPVVLGFNSATDPSHMGINVLGNWFEAKGRASGILGPGSARSSWAVTGTPQFHDGGRYRSPRPGGEGMAMLKDEEMVVRPGKNGGLVGMAGGRPIVITGNTFNVRDDADIKKIAAELAHQLELRSMNSAAVN